MKTMTRLCASCMLVLAMAAVLNGGGPQQAAKSPRILFENKDFVVVRLSDLSDPKLENEVFSGLLITRAYGGGTEPTGDVWKFSGASESSDGYYWADSARAGHLSSVSAGNYGLLVMPKSGRRLSKKIFNANLPDSLKESVSDDIQLIADLVGDSEQGKTPKPTVQNRARAGLQDLVFISDWISSSEPGTGSPSPFVNVTARTLDQSGNVVQHCWVWYAPVAWEDDKRHWKRFGDQSSPTSQAMVVGEYKMWANHNGKDGARVPVSPGDDQKPTKSIDLEVP